MKTLPIVTMMLVGAAGLAAAGDAKDAKQAAPPAMAMPKAPAEIADMAKQMGPSYRCEGTASGMDGKPEKIKMTGTTKLDLDGFWVHDSMVGGSDKPGQKFRMESFTTYDAGAKKWHRIAIMNDGGQMVGTADPMKDMKQDYLLDTWSPMGSGQFKDHVDMSDLKKGVHVWGEMSMDKGKTWMPVYDMTCKK